MNKNISRCIWGILALLMIGKYQGADSPLQQKAMADQWQALEGRHTVVYYQQSKEEAAMAMRAADLYYPLVAADFQWERQEKPIFVLYHDKKQMAQALGIREEADIPMGAYKGGRIAILSPSVWASGESYAQLEAFLEKGPIAHELIHFAMDDISEGIFPVWLTEGVALYYEKKYTGFEWRPDLKEESRSLSPQCLQNAGEVPVPLFYRKSYELVADFVRVHKEEGLQQYIREKGGRALRY